MLACCDAGMLRCWHAAMLACCDAGMLRCWHGAMLACCDAGMLRCWHNIHVPSLRENDAHGTTLASIESLPSKIDSLEENLYLMTRFIWRIAVGITSELMTTCSCSLWTKGVLVKGGSLYQHSLIVSTILCSQRPKNIIRGAPSRVIPKSVI